MRVQLTRILDFSAALQMPSSPKDTARRLHGHTFGVELLLGGPLDEERGWLIDFGDVRAAFAPLAERLEHAYLNEIEGLETPALENIERWIFDRLKPALPMLESVRVTVLGEGRFAPRRLPRDVRLDLPERLAFTLESAHSLPRVAPEHKCRRLHGHSFGIEVGADNLERLAEPLQRIHQRLDHCLLNEIEGLDNPTSENLAVWIWRALQPEISGLRVVVVRESPTSACIFRGDFQA